ncbi:hypothetical protein [Micromonospora tarensis]|uniref:Uncharacterized protein n=1 Tax=Micromonospora tarensis TaxID=2806100 RepID=A0ABS1Y9U9_9ACTN|nr:hypothetical protein [Micromonospora tarensis]MBM0274157.1 hypothetical protein [Micromonospora tarensis]
MWNPFRRRRRQLDQTSPTTASACVTPPGWNAPTLIPTTAPLLTPGQKTRTCGDMR